MGAVQDVYDYLEAQGVAGGSTGWTLLRRRMMDDPAEDQAVVVSEDGGLVPEIFETFGIGDSALKDIAILVTVRAAPWQTDDSHAKADDIYDALHGLLHTVVGATTYLRIRAQTPEPVFSGYGDDRGRPRHTIGFMLLADV